MRLAVFVQYRSRRVAAHANRAQFVDDHPADRDPFALIGGWRRSRDLPAHRLQNRLEGLVHVRGLLAFMIGPGEVEARHRDAPLIHHVGIDLQIGVLVGDLLAAAG